MSRIEKAKKAFKQKDKKLSKKAHNKKAIQQSLHDHHEEQDMTGKYHGDAVYGALDGMVTTFAIVSGVVGADLDLSIILILGFANLLADGFSMAAGSYLSTKSEQDYHRQEYNRERWEVENYPKGEIEEIREIYRQKGFKGKDLERAVEIITSDKERWIDTMMVEELGILQENKSPWIVGGVTLAAFVICGFLPLVTFVILYFIPEFNADPFLLSCLITGVSIFIVGALRSIVIAKNWLQAGLEMLLVGGAASAVAYYIGYFLKGLA